MVRSRSLRCLLLLAALGALLATVAAIPAPESTAVDGQDTLTNDETPFLGPPVESVARENYTDGSIDVAAAAAADAQQLRGEYRAQQFVTRFEGATDADRAAIASATVATLADDSTALDTRHASVIADYASGDSSGESLLRELVRITRAATQQDALADRVENAVDEADGVSLSDAESDLLGQVPFRIANLESPVTDALVESDLEHSVYVQASDDALVLATPGLTQTRQATLRGERNESAPNQFFEGDRNPNSLALERAEELYPGLANFGFSPPPGDVTSVYTIDGETTTSSLRAYLDGATRNVFHEVQEITSPTVPVSGTVSDEVGSVTLVVDTTYPTGPMRVSVTDVDSPVEDVTITIDGASVASTGITGERWVVQPLGGATLRVTVDGETLSVEIP